MVAQGQEDTDYGRNEHPPFLLTLIQAERQQEKEDRNRTHVHRAGGEGLRTPVERQLLGNLAEIRLVVLTEQADGFGLFRIDGTGGGAAVEIRNHQVRQFLPAIGPGSCIFQVQAAAGRIAVAGQVRTATHGLLGIFIGRNQPVGIRTDTQQAEAQQQGGGKEEVAEAFLTLAQQPDQQDQYVRENDDGQIVGNLDVVGLDLEIQGKSEQRRTQQGRRQPFVPVALLGKGFPVGPYHGRQNPRRPGHRKHLGIVPHLDDLEIVCAESHGDGAAHGQQPVHSEGQHQQERPQQRDEQVARRPAARQGQIVERKSPVAGGIAGHHRGRHSAEHGAGPAGPVVGMRCVPLIGLVRHADIAVNIALVDDLAGQDFRDIAVSKYEEEGDDAAVQENMLDFLVHLMLGM